MSLTVTFDNLDNPRRSLADLQLLLVFCHLSAGQPRATAQKSYMRMIDYLDKYVGGAGKTPVEIIRKMADKDDLNKFVKDGLGITRQRQAAQSRQFFEALAETALDLHSAGRDELARSLKISQDKAALFVMFRDQTGKIAVVDASVQKWLRKEFNRQGLSDQAAQIPAGKLRSARDYKKVEQAFLEVARKQDVDPRALYIDILKQSGEKTRYDEAEARRIKNGGRRYESHWNSRMSCNNIALHP